jgi:choline monooxygenase
MVFVHPDAGAAPLGATLGDLPNEIGSYQPELLTQVAHERIVGDFNWKLFVENHIDVYHLWYLHETTLGDFDHTRFEHRSLGANWVSYEPTKPSVPHVEHGIKHLADRDRNGIGAHMVFPNLLMATTADFFATYAVYPLAPTRSLIDLRIRADAGTDGAPLAAAARSFIDEDVNACEAVQAVTMSDRFDVGALARDHELLTLSKFHHNLLSALGEHP